MLAENAAPDMAEVQDSLFPDLPPAQEVQVAPPPPEPAAGKKPRTGTVEPAPTDPALVELAAALPPNLRLGTSSWSYPGWAGLVWNGEYAESVLS